MIRHTPYTARAGRRIDVRAQDVVITPLEAEMLRILVDTAKGPAALRGAHECPFGHGKDCGPALVLPLSDRQKNRTRCPIRERKMGRIRMFTGAFRPDRRNRLFLLLALLAIAGCGMITHGTSQNIACVNIAGWGRGKIGRRHDVHHALHLYAETEEE